MKSYRVTNTLTITEPEPGRVLREADPEAGVETTWTFAPVEGGSCCEVKLESQFRSRPGFAGLLERLLNPPIIRSMYRRELDLLNAYVTA